MPDEIEAISDEPVRQGKCGKCKSLVYADEKFCPICGAKLNWNALG